MFWQRVGALIIGIFVGFLGGLFGKGGSAIATPLLSLIGFPGFVAVAAPLPATIPGTLVAAAEYSHSHWMDWPVFWWSVAIGVPAAILGAYLSKLTGSTPLLLVTGVLVLAFGLSFLFEPRKATPGDEDEQPRREIVRPRFWKLRLVGVAAGVGLVSGLLANSGGFLLAPSYAKFLGHPIKRAFATSLAVAAVLAVPGTVVHAYLGHIDWAVAGLIAVGSVPSSYFGAKLALRSRSEKLEMLYGAVLTALGAFFLIHGVR